MTWWLVPTVRATAWGPLAGVAVCFAVVVLVATKTDAWPTGALSVAAAALAAAVVAGLDDPADALLSASPTSAARRRNRRLLLLLPCGLAVWMIFVSTAHLASIAPQPGWPLGPVAALTATGLAVAVWAPEEFGVEAGVGAPVLWYAVTWAGGSSVDGPYADIAFAWQHHPWLVTVGAGTLLVLGRNR